MTKDEFKELGHDEEYLYTFGTYIYDNEEVSLVIVQDEMKLELSRQAFNILIKQEYVKNNFKLNVKLLKNEWYSVYFKGKDRLDKDEFVGQVEYF